uniref:Uncharacterized protein n=1 Tax=Anguilla anguilla TaxID=7936 RepID=A0A0E9R7L2_ANGAN
MYNSKNKTRLQKIHSNNTRKIEWDYINENRI